LLLLLLAGHGCAFQAGGAAHVVHN
jgi:hypothetical protein